MTFTYHIEGGNFAEAGHISSEVKRILKQLNLSNDIIRKVVITCYEAEINVVAHAYSGDALIEILEDKIIIEMKDNGPGITDINLAMQEGYSTADHKVREMGFGAGMGLPNIKKNSDELHLESILNEGTKITITHYI
jgi:serine/threonine-protein kinase RsbT